MAIVIPDIPIDEFITGDKFRVACDIDSEKDQGYINRINYHQDKVLTVFSQTHELKNRIPLLKNIEKSFVIVSHNSDGNILNNSERIEYDYVWKETGNIPHWYCQNTLIGVDTIVPIPIGLENAYIFKPEQKQQYMIDIRRKRVKKKIAMFICYNPETNKAERYPPLKIFKDHSWVTIVNGHNNIDLMKCFFDNMRSHQFILCPAGNGVDTHRLWEALYLGCIPIVKRYRFTEYFVKYLPILIVDSWEEITLKFLINKFIEMDNKEYDYTVLKMSYWKNKILTTKKELSNGIPA